jgi:hypothetical protein
MDDNERLGHFLSPIFCVFWGLFDVFYEVKNSEYNEIVVKVVSSCIYYEICGYMR